MRIVAQRVSQASVTVRDELISKIDKGIMALIGIFQEDTMEIAENMAAKLAHEVKIFSTDGSNWNQTVSDIEGSVLCVSQFTLCANLKKGAKPDFHAAMPGPESRKLFDYFCEHLQKLLGSPERVKKGKFGEKMLVELENDGPVTVVIDSTASQTEEIK